MFLRKVTLLRDQIDDIRSYPFSIPVIAYLTELEFHRPVTFFVGENGTGKSTLLEAIAYQCGFNVAGGGRHNTYDPQEDLPVLGEYLRLSWLPKTGNGFFLRAETFFSFSKHLEDLAEFSAYGGKSLLEQSHGEAFTALFRNRFRSRGIYLMDEPEAALSPLRQLAFLRIMKDWVEEDGSQLIIATHSPILLAYPDADILSFDGERIRRIRYEETSHYVITKRFLDDRETFFHELFDEETD